MSVGSLINSGFGPAGNLARRIPGKVWVAVGCLLVAAFWLEQHDTRVRQQAQLQQLKQQTSAQVAALKKQAERDVKQANVENAKAIQKLEARRREIEQQSQKLAAQLVALRQHARTQAEQVATLPMSQVVTRVAAQLGLQQADLASIGEPQAGKGRQEGSTARAGFPASLGMAPSSHGNADTTKNAAVGSEKEITPHPTAGASTLSPGRGLGHASFSDVAKNAMDAPPSGKETADSRKGAKAQSIAATNSVAMALTGSGARKVETALVELNACRAQSGIQSRQVGNLQARAEVDDATIKRQAGSIASLNQALQAKDEILNQQASECKAELKAARGTFLGRLAHVTEHIAIGVAMGVAVGVVVR